MMLQPKTFIRGKETLDTGLTCRLSLFLYVLPPWWYFPSDYVGGICGAGYSQDIYGVREVGKGILWIGRNHQKPRRLWPS